MPARPGLPAYLRGNTCSQISFTMMTTKAIMTAAITLQQRTKNIANDCIPLLPFDKSISLKANHVSQGQHCQASEVLVGLKWAIHHQIRLEFYHLSLSTLVCFRNIL